MKIVASVSQDLIDGYRFHESQALRVGEVRGCTQPKHQGPVGNVDETDS